MRIKGVVENTTGRQGTDSRFLKSFSDQLDLKVGESQQLKFWAVANKMGSSQTKENKQINKKNTKKKQRTCSACTDLLSYFFKLI